MESDWAKEAAEKDGELDFRAPLLDAHLPAHQNSRFTGLSLVRDSFFSQGTLSAALRSLPSVCVKTASLSRQSASWRSKLDGKVGNRRFVTVDVRKLRKRG